jgi:hypothetical protein
MKDVQQKRYTRDESEMGAGKTNILVSMSVMIMHCISRSFSHAFFSLCVLRTHIEGRFYNPHDVILLT